MADTRPRGRRPGNPDVTRRAILDAARARFGQVGFHRATIRSIAESAGVDPALVIHHFTNKRKLFVAAHDLPVDPSQVIDQIAAMPLGQRGQAIARAYLTLLTPDSPVLSLHRAAASDESAAAMLREFIERSLVAEAARIVPGPNPELRMALIGSHFVGLLYAREVIGLDPLVTASIDDLIDLVAPAVQHYLQP